MRIFYGFYNGQLFDNREKDISDWSIPPFSIEDNFDSGSLKVFINWDGFLVFDKNVNIVDVFIAFFDELSSKGCCGRCFPGKFGTKILKEFLEKNKLSKNYNAVSEIISTAKDIAEVIYNTSKCTNAPMAVLPFLHFLKYFSDEFKFIENDGILNYEAIQTAPCTMGCPANIKIPEFIEQLKDYEPMKALEIIRLNMPLAGVCGRVCPHPCESNCRRGLIEEPVNIMVLKRFAWDYPYYHNKKIPELIYNNEKKNKTIAIIGGGPAGLSATYYLLKKGYEVKIYEWLPVLGGMVAVGIPSFRQPRDLLKEEIEDILNMGAKVFHNVKIGRDIHFSDIIKNNDATLITVGAFKSRDMGVIGENEGYYGLLTSGIDFLREVSLNGTSPIGRNVVIVGGGNTAIDCSRTAVRLGAKKVTIAYRRSREEMPAEDYEIKYAIEEGVDIKFLVAPIKILAKNNKVVGMECLKMKLTEPDETGRRRPVPVEASNFVIDCDTIIPAIGQYPDLDFLKEDDGLEVTKWNTIKTIEDVYLSTKTGVFVAGDCRFGPDTVVRAIGEGRKAALMIDRYLMEGKPYLTDNEKLELIINKNHLAFNKNEKIDKPRSIDRINPYMLNPDIRKNTFEEVEKPYDEFQSYLESTRCMRCVRMALIALG